MACSLIDQKRTGVSEKYSASISLSKINSKMEIMQQRKTSFYCWFFGSFFNLEDGSSTLLRNVGKLLSEYTALRPKR
jgi:hypothetical protein